MEAKMEKIEKNVVKIEVKVESEKFSEALKKAYNKNKMHFNVQGFRKGKVPMAMIKKFYGVEVLFDDAINYLIEETYPDAVNQNELKPVDYPKIDIIEVGEGKDLVYSATITVYPEVELGEYKGLEVTKPVYEVKDEDIQKSIDDMLQKNARVEVKKEGTVEKGDIAVIDFKGFVDGEAFKGGDGEDYPLEIGSGSFIDNFEDQLIGLAQGEQKDVNVKFPENYGKEDLNGKDVVFKVTVKEIKVKEIPAADDEFAKDVSEFDTIAELKEDIKKKMEEENDNKIKNELEELVIGASIEKATIDLPEVMVEKEIDNMISDLENKLKYQGLTLEQYIQYTGNDEQKMREYMKENAERKVRADLVLNAIAKVENIEATEEELKEKATEVAKMYQSEPDEKMINLLISAQKDMLESDIKINKTIKLLIDNAVIS